jgi:hypothetical protein
MCTLGAHAERLLQRDDQELLRPASLVGGHADQVALALGLALVFVLLLALDVAARAGSSTGLLHDVRQLVREQVPTLSGAWLVFSNSEVHVAAVRKRARSELVIHAGGVATGMDTDIAEAVAEALLEERAVLGCESFSATARQRKLLGHAVRAVWCLPGVPLAATCTSAAL